MLYQSRQWMILLWILLPLTTFAVAIFGLDGATAQKSALIWKVLGLMMLINLIALTLFARLTIQLKGDKLRWYFGLFGRPKWELSLSQIQRAEVCNTKWYEGKGIRFTAEGMLYNAAGSGAVRILKIDGSKLRLGSSEPEVLCQKINASLTGAS